jgi:hypothetical protein
MRYSCACNIFGGFQMHCFTLSNVRYQTILPCLFALGMVAGCASTPREVASYPVQVRLESKSIAQLPGLEPRLVAFSDKRIGFMLNPPEQWQVQRMHLPELQEMIEHCARSGSGDNRPTMLLRRAVLTDSDGAVLATFSDGDKQPLTSLSRYAGHTVTTSKPANAVLTLEVDPDRFHGQLRTEFEGVFHDAEAQVAPGVYARVESITATTQEVTLSQRTARVNHLYVQLHNRSSVTYSLNGYDTGALETTADRMLTANSLHGTVMPPGKAVIVRLPIELSQTSLAPGRAHVVELDEYLAGWNGVLGPSVVAQVPLRIQIELKGGGRDADPQRGFLTPTLQVQKRYHVERAGCFN